MRTQTRVFLAILAIVGSLIVAPTRTRSEGLAQAQSCTTYSNFGTLSPWTVIHGFEFGSGGENHFAESNSGSRTVVNGVDSVFAQIALSGLPPGTQPISITFQWEWLDTGFQTTQTARILAIATSSNYSVSSAEMAPNAQGSFNTDTLYFNQQAEADGIDIGISQPFLANNPTVAISVSQLCFISTATQTPPPSDTATATPLPTNTPTQSNTPAVSDTPTNTATSGPSPTASPSLTPGPTLTATSGLNTGGTALFSTVPPPSNCNDPLHPCGANPYPVPGFPPLNLPSPPPVTANSLNPSETLRSPITGTPGGTGTPGTGTPGATTTPGDGENAITMFATNAKQASDSLPGDPGLTDDNNGGLLTLRDSANEIGAAAGSFFAIIRAIQGFFLGKTGAIIAFGLLIVGFIFLVRFALFAVPIIVALFKLLLLVINSLKP